MNAGAFSSWQIWAVLSAVFAALTANLMANNTASTMTAGEASVSLLEMTFASV